MGTDLVSIDNVLITIDLATKFGPRVLGLTPAGSKNLLAEVPERKLDLPAGRSFSLRGGHRLLLAPEVPEITYEPDDNPVTIESSNNSASATGVVANVEKTIAIELDDGTATATVTHAVTNRGRAPIEMAPWALTQVRTGGTALLPVGDVADASGYQAASQIVGWRYTDWGALEAGPAGVICFPATRTTPSKIGTALTRGWLAYLVDGWLFAKYATVTSSPLDLGATGQIYADADFLELETLGAPTTLEPGQAVEHNELWRVWPAPGSLDDAVEVVEAGRV